MASTVEETKQEIDAKIEEIRGFVAGFRNLEPGGEIRKKYITETVGDAEHYLAGVLTVLRKARKLIPE